MNIAKLRKELSRIDDTILKQLLARQTVVTEVAHYKRKKNIKTHQPVCECEKITHLVKAAVEMGIIDPDLVVDIFRLIFVSSRAQQDKIRKGKRPKSKERTPPQ